MTVTQLVAYERTLVEGLNRADISVADQVLARDCVVHLTGIAEPVRGVAAWKEIVGGLLAAFADLHFTIDDQIVDGDRVAISWRARGTHRGPLGPVAPTGRSIAVDGVIFDYVVDGKVIERWEQWDSRSCSSSSASSEREGVIRIVMDTRPPIP